MEETDAVKKLLTTLSDLTGTISNQLKENILEKTLSETLDEITRHREDKRENNKALNELEQAKLLNMYAYILVSLSFTSAKLDGIKFNNDAPIMQEIKRVKEYMDRVKKAEDFLFESTEETKKREAESESFINKHLGEPAVSKVHFQDREETNKVQPESKSNHQYFKDDDKLRQAVQAAKEKKRSDGGKQSKSKSKNKNRTRQRGSEDAKKERISKSQK